MDNEFDGRSVIVTGGGSGIGRAAAILLAKKGCSVTVADLDEAGGRMTVELIGELPSARATFVSVNVADEGSVAEMVTGAVSAYGKLDGAINCAGIQQNFKLLHELSLAEWDRCGSVNLRGQFLCMREELKAMLKDGAGRGAIVAFSSNAAIVGIPHSPEYCAAKAGVLGLVRGAAVDYATSGIRINAILPGGTDTPGLRRAFEGAGGEEAIGGVIAGFPMKRLGRPEEIAAGAVWLISDAASYVTGVSLSIDGAHSIS